MERTLTRAYVTKIGDRWYVFIGTPRKTWVKLADYGLTREETERWVKDCGWQLITYDQSFD